MNTDYELEICIVNRLKKRPATRRDDLHCDIYGQKTRIDDAVQRLIAAGRVKEVRLPGIRGIGLYAVGTSTPLPPPAPKVAS